VLLDDSTTSLGFAVIRRLVPIVGKQEVVRCKLAGLKLKSFRVSLPGFAGTASDGQGLDAENSTLLQAAG
jgi:hypothetical protein